MGRIKSDPVPGTGRADVPASLERLLRQAMAKDPAARPQTAMELIRGLQSVEQELRLPVTQPILPSAGPAGGTPGDNTTSIPAVRSGETTYSRGHDPARGYRDEGPATPDRLTRGASGWDPGHRPGPRASVPGAGGAPWGQTSATAGYRGLDAETRARGPRRIDPWSPPGAPLPGSPVPGGTVGPGPGGRVRQFPQQAPEPATVARPRRIAPGGAVASGAVASGAAGA
jgi:hypothetical protein